MSSKVYTKKKEDEKIKKRKLPTPTLIYYLLLCGGE